MQNVADFCLTNFASPCPEKIKSGLIEAGGLRLLSQGQSELRGRAASGSRAISFTVSPMNPVHGVPLKGYIRPFGRSGMPQPRAFLARKGRAGLPGWAPVDLARLFGGLSRLPFDLKADLDPGMVFMSPKAVGNPWVRVWDQQKKHATSEPGRQLAHSDPCNKLPASSNLFGAWGDREERAKAEVSDLSRAIFLSSHG